MSPDSDKPRLLALGGTKISGLDPPLTAVFAAHPSEPLLAFSDPPVQLATAGPGCGLNLDRWIDFLAVGFAVLIRIQIPHI